MFRTLICEIYTLFLLTEYLKQKGMRSREKNQLSTKKKTIIRGKNREFFSYLNLFEYSISLHASFTLNRVWNCLAPTLHTSRIRITRILGYTPKTKRERVCFSDKKIPTNYIIFLLSQYNNVSGVAKIVLKIKESQLFLIYGYKNLRP